MSTVTSVLQYRNAVLYLFTATFQTMMDDIFEDLILEGVIVVYLDDILIFTETLDEHWRIMHCILELLEKHKLYLCTDKCEFEKTMVYLGVIISHNSVVMDPVKIAGIAEWPTSTNKKEGLEQDIL